MFLCAWNSRSLAFLGILLLLALGSACRKRPAPPQPYRAFVANRQSNSVVSVDLATLRITALIPVANGPEQMAIRPGSRELCVVTASGTIHLVDYPALRVAHSLRVGPSARSLAFSPDGRWAYVLSPLEKQIVFLDCVQAKEVARLKVGASPANLALTPDGNTIVVADNVENRLFFVSAESRKILGSVGVGKSPGPLVALPYGAKVLVGDTEEEKVTARQPVMQ